jgi:hypothetical protein
MTPATAEELRNRFSVYGRFYRRRFEGRTFELRSHLEIFEQKGAWRGFIDADADLVAIMMNPGAARPTAPPDLDGWAPAVPDRTQYQLMKLALYASSKGWPIRHIRVINLSDLRTPKSGELFATMQTLSDDGHSVFSPPRRRELDRALGSPAVPLLFAWGLADQLKVLARSCLDLAGERRVLGLTDNGLQFRHPLPQRADMQQAWLARICAQIDAWT